MVLPFMSMYATQKLGFSIASTGFLMAFFGIGSVIGAFVGGKITDKIGFYGVQLFALFGGGFMFIVIGYLTNYIALCVGILLLSIVNEAFRPANSAAIAYYSIPQNRTRSYSLNRLAINLGWAFGGSIGGFLAAHSYHSLFWVDGCTNIAAGVLLLVVLKKPVLPITATLASAEKKTIKHSAYTDRPYLVFIGLTILFAFCFFQLFTLLPVYYKTEMLLSEKEIGLLMAINGLLIAFTEMVLVYNLERKRNPLRYISYGVWLTGLSYLVFILLQGQFLIALLSVLVITLGEMLSMPFMNTYWISRSSDNNRGQYAALYTMAWGISQIAAPSVGGWIADAYSFNTLFVVLFVTSVVGGLGYYKLMQQPAGTGT